MTDAKLTTDNPDAIVYLRSAGDDDGRCCKTVARFPDGRVDLSGYPKGRMWYFPDMVVATNFDSMCVELAKLARRHDCFILRDGLRNPEAYDGKPIKRRGAKENDPWKDVPRNWIALDLDSVIAPPDVDPIEWLISVLPAPFTGVSFWYQWTSSYLVTSDAANVLRIRLWFRLSKPIDIPQCKALTPLDKWHNPEAPVNLKLDHNLYRIVQPHYINAPVFEGGAADPLPGNKRYGIVHGIVGDEVQVNDLPTYKRNPLQYTVQIADEAEPDATEFELKEFIRRTEIAAMNPVVKGRHQQALTKACDGLRLGASPDVVEHLARIMLRKPGTTYGRDEAPGEVEGIVRTAYQKKADGTLFPSITPARAVFASTPIEVSAKKADAPIDLPPDPEPGDGAAIYGKDDVQNALIFIERNFPVGAKDKGFFRLGGQDWIYRDGRYTPEIDEILDARVTADMLSPTKVVKSTLFRIRKLMTREDMAIPCWLDGTTSPAPRDVAVFRNGMLNMWDFVLGGKAELIPHSPRFAATYCLPYDYDPTATCPRFDALLKEIWPDDEIAREEICKVLGLFMLPITKFQKIFFFEGESRSGKGTLARLAEDLIGEENTSAIRPFGLADKFGQSSALGKLLVTVAESNENERKSGSFPQAAVDFLKAVSGEDRVQIDRKNKELFSGRLFCRFLISANNAFKALDDSGALARRLYLFRFEHSVVNEDVDLQGKLRRELSGIANRALQGLRTLLHPGSEGLRELPSSRQRMAEISRQQAPARWFAKEYLRARTPADAGTPPLRQEDVMTAFRLWSKKYNLDATLSVPQLFNGIHAAGLDNTIDVSSGSPCATGILLAADAPSDTTSHLFE